MCAALTVAAFAPLMLTGCGSSSDAVRTEAYDNLASAQAAEYGQLSESQVQYFNQRLKDLDASTLRHETELADGIRSQLVQAALAYEAALINGISDTGNPRVRATSAFMLGFLGKGEPALTLARIMADSSEESFMRNRASIGLAMLGPAINGSADRDAVMATLAQMMLTKHASPSVRVHAAMAYAKAYDLRRNDSLEPLKSSLVEDWSNEVRVQVLNALGDLGSAAESAIPEISNALRDTDTGIRAAAAQALGKIPHPAAYAELYRATDDQAGRVRRDAVYAMVGQKSVNIDGVRERIVHGLGDTDETVRSASAGAAGLLKDSELVIPLLSSLSDTSAKVRTQAIGSLGEIVPKENQSAAYHLVFSLDDGNTEIRSAALSSLKKITGENIQGDSEAWRKWFYAKYPDTLDPEVVYKDQVKPRYFADGNRTGNGGMPRANTPRTTRNNTSRNNNRNNNNNNNGRRR